MLAILIESGAPRPPQAWPARVASALAHGLLVTFAAVATQAPPPSDGPGVRDTTIYFPIDPVPARPTQAGLPGLPGLPSIRLPSVLDIPSSIPLPTLAVPSPGMAAWVDPWPGAPGMPGDSGTGVPGAVALPVDARIVEQAPRLLTHPVPRYPELLRQAGIEGTVLVEAVLDTLGRVEPASVRIARGAHALFETEALAVVRGSRYQPGRMGAHAVRVRIQVPVGFSLRR